MLVMARRRGGCPETITGLSAIHSMHRYPRALLNSRGTAKDFCRRCAAGRAAQLNHGLQPWLRPDAALRLDQIIHPSGHLLPEGEGLEFGHFGSLAKATGRIYVSNFTVVRG